MPIEEVTHDPWASPTSGGIQEVDHNPWETAAADPEFEREKALYKRQLGSSGQILTGIPLVGPLAEKGLAAANAAIDPLVGRGGGASYGDRYSKQLKALRASNEEFQGEHPYLSPALQIGGGLAAMGAGNRLAMTPVQIQGPPGVWTNIGSQLTNAPARSVGGSVADTLLGTGGNTLAGQVVRSGTSGAVLGGADAALRDENVGGGAAIGGLTGAAGPVAGRVAGNVVNRLSGTTAAARPPTDAQNLTTAKQGYNAARASDFVADPVGLHDLSNTAEIDLAKAFTPTQAPETFDILRRMREQPQPRPAGGAGTGTMGPAPYDANQLMSWRDQLKATMGGLDPRDAKAAGQVLERLDNYLENINQLAPHHVSAGDPQQFAQNLREANANYSAGKTGERFAHHVLDRSERQAGRSYAGENRGNALRARMDAVYENATKPEGAGELGRGLNGNELAAMRQQIVGTPYTNLLRRLQHESGGLRYGGMLGLLGAGMGAHLGGVPGAAIGAAVPRVASEALRRGTEARTLRGANDIYEMIRRRAPASAAANAAEAQRLATQQEMTRAGALASRAAEPGIADLFRQ